MLAGGITDANLARLAAQQAIAAAQAGPLVTIAQTVAFAMASLDSLRLSAPPDLSITTKLRLRGNANALNRSANRAAAAQKPQRHKPEIPSASPKPPTQESDRERETLWANAMTDVAAECSRNLAKLPPQQRRAEMIRIAALKATAAQLRKGDPSSAKPHPAQQPVPQHDLMIQRPQNVQPGNPKQHIRNDLVNVAHLPPPS
jgi:hypothetical protein